MKLDDIEKLWAVDVVIDKTDIDSEALKIPYLHAKYWKILINEKLHLRKLKDQQAQLKKLKTDYYGGKFSEQDYKETGWPIIHNLILKTDIPLHMDSDNDVIDLNIKVTHQEEKCKFLEDIIKSLHTRGFLLKNAIDFIKFTNGLG